MVGFKITRVPHQVKGCLVRGIGVCRMELLDLDSLRRGTTPADLDYVVTLDNSQQLTVKKSTLLYWIPGFEWEFPFYLVRWPTGVLSFCSEKSFLKDFTKIDGHVYSTDLIPLFFQRGE